MKKYQILVAGLIVIFAIIAIVFFWPRTPLIKNSPPRGNNIVAIGDSLTVGVGDSSTEEGKGGWAPIVENKLGITITRFANSGDTVADGLARLDAVRAAKPDIAIVFLGGNDALRQYPVDETFSGLKKMITTLQDDGVLVAIIGVRGGIFGDRYKNEFTKLASDTHSVLVPDVMSGIFGNPKLLSEDQIHPNTEGYKLIAERAAGVLGRYLKK